MPFRLNLAIDFFSSDRSPGRDSRAHAFAQSSIRVFISWKEKAVMSDGSIGNIGQFLLKAMVQLQTKNDEFMTKMDDMSKSSDGITQEDMVLLQYEIGQYNALLESVSNISKSLTDSLKSLAQKVG
jgi:type III secretion protein F